MSTPYNPLNVMMGNPGRTGVPYVGGKPTGSGGSVGPVNSGQFNFGGGGRPSPSPIPSGGGSVGPVRAGQFTGQNPAGGTPPYQAPPPVATPNVLGPESVRATGPGPFDSAYRQDLATFAGGLFNKPGGNLSFNPTDQNAFGAPTGGGNAPLLGMPATLLQNALGGNPFSYTPPPPVKTASSGSTMMNMEDWFKQFMNQGQDQRGRMAMA